MINFQCMVYVFQMQGNAHFARKGLLRPSAWELHFASERKCEKMLAWHASRLPAQPGDSVPAWCVCSRSREMPTLPERVCCAQVPENCISLVNVNVKKMLAWHASRLPAQPGDSVPAWCVCSRSREMPTLPERVCCAQVPENCISLVNVNVKKNVSLACLKATSPARWFSSCMMCVFPK